MADYFSIAESAVVAVVRDHLDNKAVYFTKPAKQITKSDDSVLGEGFEYFFITYPGAFPVVPQGVGVIEVTWMIGVDIFCRFTTYPDTWKRFKAFRSDVFNLFDVNKIGRNLDRTPGVRDVLLSSESEVVGVGEEDSPADPIFFKQSLQLAVYFKVNRE